MLLGGDGNLRAEQAKGQLEAAAVIEHGE